MKTITIIPETRLTHPLTITLPKWLTVRPNGYGGLIIEGPCGFYAQKSGHGVWCEWRLGPFEIWADVRTGRPFHFVNRCW